VACESKAVEEEAGVGERERAAVEETARGSGTWRGWGSDGDRDDRC
jgi:hypothetical protein